MNLLRNHPFNLLAKRIASARWPAAGSVDVPDWPDTIHGFTYAPFHSGQSPFTKRFPSREQIREDLLLIRRFTRRVRIYSVEGTLALIPELALELGMEVTLGAWISRDQAVNRREIATAVELCNRVSSIRQLLVGNEVLYRGDLSLEQLIEHIDNARRQVSVPVATSEIWVQWLATPQLAQHSDFIAAHILPFWEAIPVTAAGDFVVERAQELRKTFADKPLVISEIGWPSRSSVFKGGHSCAAAQAIYLRGQLPLLEQQHFSYFVIEAFDQPWKAEEGISGPHWGVFTARRRLKLQLSGSVSVPLDWRAHGRSLVTFLRPRSWLAALIILTIVFCGLLWVALKHSTLLPLWAAMPLSVIWSIGLLTGIAVETHEFLEACWSRAPPRLFHPRRLAHEQPAEWPKVSVHVPCYDEPAHMVISTLDRLHDLDYPKLEVLVIDNNTQNPDVWRPVERHCRRLGPRFRFFHVAPLAGFKAGALNYLLNHTAPDSEIVAVVDADYRVNRQWLKHMVPYFADPRIAVIQLPQDYRDAEESLFKHCCRAEYRGFFTIGMVIRNDHDAIIQHGTMTLIRRSALQHLGWAQWSICEDAELGLRMLENGFSTGYAPFSYGKGLIPDTFGDFKKQRYRWAYGAVQIVKRHADSLIGGRNPALSAMQRYHFLAGWVPWAAQGVNYLLTQAALLWSLPMLIAPETFTALPWLFSTSLLLMFALRILKILLLYGRLISADIREALAAILAGLALYPTIGRAVLAGLFSSGLPFLRTPKHVQAGRWAQAIIEVREELCMVVLAWLVVSGLWLTHRAVDIDLALWLAMLLAQSLPNLAAVVMALLSAWAAAPRPGNREIHGA
jgi:exo-beta-1,3-glucanase (GH17 family)/cellulose synthase/poly-beta-1,6-N-acetylglucosamine synthase-like glycosyltransferase